MRRPAFELQLEPPNLELLSSAARLEIGRCLEDLFAAVAVCGLRFESEFFNCRKLTCAQVTFTFVRLFKTLVLFLWTQQVTKFLLGL